MKMKKTFFAISALLTAAALAQSDARAIYQHRQAVQEVQRLSSQFDQIQNGMDALTSRMSKLESGNSTEDVRAEIAALRSEIASLKRRQDAMRGEIIAEISKKMADIIAKNRPAPASSSPSCPTNVSVWVSWPEWIFGTI